MDGQPFDVTDKMSYRGVMFEGIPNAAMVFGYTNSLDASDLIADYFCRIVTTWMIRATTVIPVNHDPGMAKVLHRPDIRLYLG